MRGVLGRIAVAVFEIAADGQIDSGGDASDVLQHGVAAYPVVRFAGRKSIAGAGGGQRFKAEVREQARCANVPGVGDDECAFALVERAKDAGFFGLREHWTSIH